MTTTLIEKYTNEHSRFLPVRGTLMHYRMEGKGPFLVLLHGSFSSLHTYDEWTKILARKFTVVRMDLPGFGLTGPCAEQDYHMSLYLQYLHAFTQMLNIKKFNLAGSSLGGWIAWEYALAYPEQVQRLILIDSAGFIDERNLPLPFRMARTPFFNRVIKFAVSRSMLEEFVRDVYHNQSKVNPELVDRYYELFNRPGNPEAFLKLVNARYKDNSRHLKKLHIPTLIMWGKEDRWLSVENAYKFHEYIPENDLVIYDYVGHLPMEEIPGDSAQELMAFVKNAG